jgi:hypothetical protein
MKRNPLILAGLIVFVGLAALVIAISGGSANNRRTPTAQHH